MAHSWSVSKRALVLAGGGLAGIAWETGVLCGIADEDPALARSILAADVVVGTSAGSAVAAQVTSGATLEDLFARQVREEHLELRSGVDIEAIYALFLEAVSEPGMSKVEKLKRIGRIALDTPTVSESVRRAVIEARLPSREWPERDLRITAIDTATGELVVFDNDFGVSLVDAVAASCAVPGAWPSVTIGARRYMDGGVGSAVNLSVARDCNAAVVLVPSGADSPSPFGAGAAAEVESFDGEGLGVFADDESLEAFGPDPLDPACRIPSAKAGRAQGRRYARRIGAFLR